MGRVRRVVIGATRRGVKCANNVLLESQGPAEVYASAVLTQQHMTLEHKWKMSQEGSTTQRRGSQ